MGIYLSNMEMPNKKNGTVLIIYPDGKCAFEDGKTYQAVPVPPHGRLGDLDALHKLFLEKGKKYKGVGGAMVAAAAWCIANAPTIIPSSEEGET